MFKCFKLAMNARNLVALSRSQAPNTYLGLATRQLRTNRKLVRLESDTHEKEISQGKSAEQASIRFNDQVGNTNDLQVFNTNAFNDEIKEALSARLASKNFKNLLGKQDEIKKIFLTIDNPYILYYVIDTCHNEFSVSNLIMVVKRLAHIKKSIQQSAESTLDLHVPKGIVRQLDKTFIRLAPHFEPGECLTALRGLNTLDFTLNDYSLQAVLQIVKYKVNMLELTELMETKKKLYSIKQRTLKPTEFSSELFKDVERSLDLAAKLFVGKLEAYASNSNLVYNFMTSFEPNLTYKNLTDILKFLVTKPDSEYSLSRLVELLELTNRRRISDQNVLKQLTGRLLKKLLLALENNEKIASKSQNMPSLIKNEQRRQLVNEKVTRTMTNLIGLDYFRLDMTEMIVTAQLKYLRSTNRYSNNELVDGLNQLLEYCAHFGYKSVELVELIKQIYFDHNESSEQTRLFESKFNFKLFHDYVKKFEFDSLNNEAFKGLY